MNKEKTASFKIGQRKIGEEQPTFIIAEVGSNHNCDLKLAKKTVKEISTTGADAVKFQSFKADLLVNPKYRPRAYKLLKSNELPREWHKILKKYAKDHGLIFLSTPFDFEAVDLLRSLNVPAYKVASGDITNIPLIRHIAQAGKPLIMSVGAADDKIIRTAVNTVKKEGNNKIVLCQCVVSYPTKYSDANVRVLDHLKSEFGTLVGYSDHSREDLVPILAVARGAVVIERHVTLSRSLPGPDHSFALEINELKEMVTAIRKAESVLGDIKKEILESEQKAFFRASRSIYARVNLKKGDKLNSNNMIILRPRCGLEPVYFDLLVGQKIKTNKNAFEPIYQGIK